MRSIRQFCAVFVLTLVLALSAFAGDMGFPGITAPGEMQTPGVTAADEISIPGVTVDPLTEMSLGFLLNLSSLL